MFSGCAQNPVTGKKELMLIPKSQEISIGESNYGPMQQSQGGIYTGSPRLTQLVQEVGIKLSKVSDAPDLPYEFIIVNDATPNAWAMPGGKIAIHRGLLVELHSEAELAAVLSHEITHAAAKHSAKSMQRQVLLGAGLLGANAALADEEHQTRNQALILAAGVTGQLIMQKYSRSHELEADHYGMIYMDRAGYDPTAAVELQKTFVKLQDGKKANWLSGMFASHPPSQERVDANQKFAATLSQHTYQGKEAYQEALKPLLAQKPAYDASEQASTLLSQNKYSQALAKINEAIHFYPNESLFYTAKGDILFQQKKHKLALAQYEKAISLNDQYFYSYLQRGLLYQALGQEHHAKLDLEKSQMLLPTENAKQALEKIAL